MNRTLQTPGSYLPGRCSLWSRQRPRRFQNQVRLQIIIRKTNSIKININKTAGITNPYEFTQRVGQRGLLLSSRFVVSWLVLTNMFDEALWRVCWDNKSCLLAVSAPWAEQMLTRLTNCNVKFKTTVTNWQTVDSIAD